ncbi:MAG: hypothetical protein A2Z11_00710 [Candidatus Woykebacteria bacterium RBG_16_43_9]|uniref:Four helix bundle protein n=1 Tax=Candidatus Woykebacteria bacterium RBG_16_43_9 TaxID=1802596 RepID=A0A1G1WCL5_9BACT|nr:MAG: hypothetical protein A2Z11_00710 [Candidatus Woykebacteria bacterium RBG_16_43_9]
MQNDKEEIKREFKKRLYDFVLKLVKFIDKLPKDGVSRVIGDQLLRSGTSIIGNYVEAQSASSKRDFTNFFNYSLKSTNESKVWVALLRDSGRAKSEEAVWFLKELDGFSKILGSSVLTLRGRR